MITQTAAPTIERKLLPKQLDFIADDQSPAILYAGAFGAGKTWALCNKIVRRCLEWPGTREGLFRKELKAVKATTLQTLLMGDGELGAALPPEYIREHNKADRKIILHNGSEILYGGMEASGRKDQMQSWINSLNLGGIAIDQAEELSAGDWDLLEGRIRLNLPGLCRQIYAVCNPANEQHFLHKAFFPPAPKSGYRLINTNSLENPYLPDDYRRRLEGYTGVFYRRYVLGEWASFEGQVYEHFNRNLHVVDPFQIPPDWPRFIAIDFGYRNPFVAQWWAQSPDNEFYMYREIYHTGLLVEHAAAIIVYLSGHGAVAANNPFDGKLRLMAATPESIGMVVCDHDAEDAATLAHHGVSNQPAYKSVMVGIEQVHKMLKPDQRGRPQIFFFNDTLAHSPDPSLEEKPQCTIDEFGAYLWPKGQDGKPMKENPVKEADHGMDAGRYLFASLYCAPVTVTRRVHNHVRIGRA